jgi:hypothetical protein
MPTIEGICDWCKRPAFLTKHEYFDGKCHYSCQSCNEVARLDVRQFNLAEQAAQQRASHRFSSIDKLEQR